MNAENNAYRAAESFRWWQDNSDMSQNEALILDAAAVRDAADELLAQRVMQARNAGMSWTKVGELLGITRQAATKRYAKVGQLPL